jgi:hypothetical protein
VSAWTYAFLIGFAGAMSGVVNALITDDGFPLPRRVYNVWCPGFITKSWLALLPLYPLGLSMGQVLQLISPDPVAAVPHCGHAGNCGALAQGRIPFVLEADLQCQEARRETTDVEGGSGIDFPDGC